MVTTEANHKKMSVSDLWIYTNGCFFTTVKLDYFLYKLRNADSIVWKKFPQFSDNEYFINTG